MKLTESVLRQMVQEELEAVLAEAEEEEKKKEEEEEDYAAKLRGSIKKSQEERGFTQKPAIFSIIKSQLKDEGKITGDESVGKIMKIWKKTGGLKPGYKRKS